MVARQATVSRCTLVPLVYRPVELDDNELMFTNILNNYLPIYWSEDIEQQEIIVNELKFRLTEDAHTRAVHNLLAG